METTLDPSEWQQLEGWVTQALTRIWGDMSGQWECKLVQSSWKAINFFVKLSVHLPSDPVIPLLKLCNELLSQLCAVALIQDHKMSCWTIWEEGLLLARHSKDLGPSQQQCLKKRRNKANVRVLPGLKRKVGMPLRGSLSHGGLHEGSEAEWL